MTYEKFEQFLLDKGVVTEEQLHLARTQQQETGKRLEQVLVDMGLVDEMKALHLLAEHNDLPFIDLKNFQPHPDLIQKLSESHARYFKAIVLEKNKEGLLVGMADPLDIPAIDELKRVLKQPIQVALVNEKHLFNTIDLIYRHTEDILSFAEKLEAELGDGRIDLDSLVGQTEQVDATVIKLLQSLFTDAVQARASDIHLEPEENILRIRIRIDGILHEQIVKEKAIAPAMASRLKLMANLNITEKRLPQDGRFNVKVHDHSIDVRLSVLPTSYGESVVLRLLDQSTHLADLDQIGMPSEVLKSFYRLLNVPYGIILVTGPTGSGKTTTLYGALNYLNSPEKKIITVEDPVEYRLARITQTQVYNKLGLTFASISRVILRNDPDIIMVGEMRDEETADTAIRAALTGHLVLSTLHTNDAPTSALRLLDMKVDGYLVASTVRGILAQRLVRRLCPNCKKIYSPTDAEKNWLMGKSKNNKKVLNAQFYQSHGCGYCNQTGYKGRIGIFELLELNKPMMYALSEEKLSEYLDLAYKALKDKFLVDSGLDIATQGITTIQEIMRVIGE
jgi:MSHA biogenesis protein MshE